MHANHACAAIIVLFCNLGTPASAQLSAEAELVSDYRYRGVSLSNQRPALQASAELDSGAGFFLGGFGSWVPRGGGETAVELDAIAGYRLSGPADLTLEGALAWYHYPGAAGSDYAEGSAVLRWERSNASARLGLSWAPRQANLVDGLGVRGDNLYVSAGFDQNLPGTPLSFAVEGGYEGGAFDGAARGGKLDWRARLGLSRGPVEASVSYVGAVRPGAKPDEARRESGLVLSIGGSF